MTTLDPCYLHYGCQISDLYISVPHQMPPRLWDATRHPPEGDDQYVAGDHDWHNVVALEAAAAYTGHQSAKVQALAKSVLATINGGE
jgi:hypothetical protein